MAPEQYHDGSGPNAIMIILEIDFRINLSLCSPKIGLHPRFGDELLMVNVGLTLFHSLPPSCGIELCSSCDAGSRNTAYYCNY